jgi:hypothetical protein
MSPTLLVSIWTSYVTKRAPPKVTVNAAHANTMPRRAGST